MESEYYSDEYSEQWQTSKMEHFAKTINGGKPLTNLSKHSILDASQGYEHTVA